MREAVRRIVGEAAEVCRYSGMEGQEVQTHLLIGVITIRS